MKTCTNCGSEKPTTDFPASYKRGPSSWCKQCYSADHQRRRNGLMFELDGIVRSGLQIRRKYGLSPEAYTALYRAQDGLCAICHSRPEGKLLVVDHNHLTGDIRELLCDACNWVIGHAREDRSILLSASDYLEKHNV